jgi:long-subunit fatty acid transport protein
LLNLIIHKTTKVMKKIIAVLLFALSTAQLSAQYYEKPKEKPSFKDKIFFGGGLGLQFGTITAIEVSPIVGYKVTERFHTGVGFKYSYFKYKDYTPTIDFSAYSGSVFTRFFITESLFAYAEVEALNTEVLAISNSTIEWKRKWIDSYFIGAGYFQRLGQRSGVYLLLLWNLNETELSPYTNPVMRIGLSF